MWVRFSSVAAQGRMMSKEPTIIELEMDELKDILRRAEAKQFNDKDYEIAGMVLQSYVELVALLKSKNVSMRRLQKLLFGASTEKTAAVPSRLKYRMSRSSRATPARTAAMARFTRRPGPGCWCRSSRPTGN